MSDKRLPRSSPSSTSSKRKAAPDRELSSVRLPSETASLQEWGVAADKLRTESNLCWRAYASDGYRTGSDAEKRYLEALSRFEYALDRAYPPGFWTVLESLHEKKPAEIEPLIVFLEKDPWFYRSGYVKETTTTALKQADLTSSQKRRLQEVLLKVVDNRFRREFKYYCRLARVIQAPWLVDALRERLNGPNAEIALRAKWMLAVCEQGPRTWDQGNRI